MPDEVAVTTSVSQGVSGVVSALPLEQGERRRIVITEFEFPTVGQIAHAQELRGAEVVHVRPGDDGTIPLERFEEAIDERTALVCCTVDLLPDRGSPGRGEIARIAHDRGALVFADAYQAAGSIPLDARALGVDFLAAGTVKYLLASAGLGFLYCRGQLAESLLPTQTGWFADEDIFRMDISDYSPHASARRFDAGTPPVPSIYAGSAGMAIVEAGRRGGDRGARPHSQPELLTGLDELGATVATPRPEAQHGALICVSSSASTSSLRRSPTERIVTSSRDGNLRISLHLYNVEEDVDRVLEALALHRALLA